MHYFKATATVWWVIEDSLCIRGSERKEMFFFFIFSVERERKVKNSLFVGALSWYRSTTSIFIHLDILGPVKMGVLEHPKRAFYEASLWCPMLLLQVLLKCQMHSIVVYMKRRTHWIKFGNILTAVLLASQILLFWRWHLEELLHFCSRLKN